MEVILLTCGRARLQPRVFSIKYTPYSCNRDASRLLFISVPIFIKIRRVVSNFNLNMMKIDFSESQKEGLLFMTIFKTNRH